MGTLFNPGNKKFRDCVNHYIYVDKTGLIGYLNRFMTGINKYICVTRPSKFGKSVAAGMLAAYYSRGCDSRDLFKSLDISRDPSFEERLNKYNVVYFDVAQFIKTNIDAETGIEKLSSEIAEQVSKQYPHIVFDQKNPISMFEKVFDKTDVGFVFIVDEWDSPFRERKNDKESQDLYLQFLEVMFKNRDYVSLVYMTGILPIKKYLFGPSLNMFLEYTAADSGPVGRYIGFTEEEVKNLAEGTEIPFNRLKYWYDGYSFGGFRMYNSYSVYRALTDKKLQDYWVRTKSFDELFGYVKDDRFGIHRAVLDLLNGIKYEADLSGYANDLVTINNLDDIFAILVHLGYLALDRKPAKKEDKDVSQSDGIDVAFKRLRSDGIVRIPNHEIYEEFLAVLENLGSFEANRFRELSVRIAYLTYKESTDDEDMEMLAESIERIHRDYVSDAEKYGSEDCLSNTVRLAYYAVMCDYRSVSEKKFVRGRADVVFIPKKGADCPPMVIEFKADDTAENVLCHIKDGRHRESFKDYKGDVIFVGITYDSETKKHAVKKEVLTVDNTKSL